MGVGQSWGAGFGIRTEGTFGTDPGAPSLFPLFDAESIKIDQALHESTGIWTSRELELITPTTYSVAGDLTMEASGINMAQLLLYWNFQVSTALNPMQITTAPGAAVAAGGSLQAGQFHYYVASIVTDPAGRRIILGRSAEANATTSGGNLTINLTWTDPTTLTLDDGYTYYGTAIYRSQTAGGSGTERQLHVVVGTGASYSDTGSINNGSSAASTIVPVSQIYRHTYTAAAPVAGTNPANSFALTVLRDLATSIRYNGCRMNTVAIRAAAGTGSVQGTFGVLAQQYTTAIANPAPTPSTVGPFMSHRTQILIAGTFETEVEGIDWNLSNNLEAFSSLNDQAYVRQIYAGRRTVTGTLRRGFEDYTEALRVGGASFAIRSRFQGPQVTASADISGSNAVAARYMMTLNAANCHYSSAVGNASGSSRMVEELPFRAFVGAGSNDVSISVDNLTSSIS